LAKVKADSITAAGVGVPLMPRLATPAATPGSIDQS